MLYTVLRDFVIYVGTLYLDKWQHWCFFHLCPVREDPYALKAQRRSFISKRLPVIKVLNIFG